MRMESEQMADLAAALAKAQGVMGPAIINRQNPHFKNRYADLAAVIDAVRKPLADNGLSVTQTTELGNGVLILRTTLWHASGQWLSSEYPLPLGAKPQELGSALTYGRRYELSALLGVAADEDDDGEATRKGNGAVETGEIITPDQVETLIDVLAARAMPSERLLKYVSVKCGREIKEIALIPVSFYDECLDKIQGAAK